MGERRKGYFLSGRYGSYYCKLSQALRGMIRPDHAEYILARKVVVVTEGLADLAGLGLSQEEAQHVPVAPLGREHAGRGPSTVDCINLRLGLQKGTAGRGTARGGCRN